MVLERDGLQFLHPFHIALKRLATCAGARRAARVGGRDQERRGEHGLSQHALATAVDVSRQTIVSMEQGGYAPSVYLALKVAAALDTTVEALWGERTFIDPESLGSG